MGKIAINNEIVLMRQAVRQSRVIVVRKLIKEAKLLQARKHGNEKTQEKCKRKAQRLVAEIEAIKKLKDDDISKFGITNTRKLSEVLSDLTCTPETRIMSRLAFHKNLSDKIAKFKEKFPEYEQHLGPGRKKLSKLQRQANREIRNAMKRNPGIEAGVDTTISNDIKESPKEEIVGPTVTEQEQESSNEEDETVEDSGEEAKPVDSHSKDDENETEFASSTVDNDETELSKPKVGQTDDVKSDELEESLTTQYNLEPGSILRINTPISAAKKRKKDESIDEELNDSKTEAAEKPKNYQNIKKSKTIKSGKEIAKEITKLPVPALKAPLEPKKPKPIKVISKEASVKRFTDLMTETDPEEIVQEVDVSTTVKKRDMNIEKEVDSFFMTENGESEYLSVVVPKSKLCEDDQQDERFSQNHNLKRQQNFHERNNKFFSKIDQRSSGNSYGDKYGSHSGKQRSNDFSNGRGPADKFSRPANGHARNSRPQLEQKIEAKEEVLHPSWAARKKQQEILKQGFQGKKIVFDD